MVAAGLLMGGGAVAVADPGSSGSAAHGDNGTNASGQPSTGAKTPKDEPGGAKKPKDHPRGTDTKDEKKDPSGTDTKDEKKDSGPVAAVPDPVAAVPNEIAAGSNEVAPVPDVAAPVSEVVGPVSDVSALIQDMLASVAGGVVPLTQLQSELAFFLFGVTGVEPVVDARGRVDSAALSTAVMPGWRRNCRCCGHLPLSRACRWPASQPGWHRSGALRRRLSAQ